MARVAIAVGVLAVVAAVSAGRVQQVPPGFASLVKSNIDNPSCHVSGDMAYKALTQDYLTSPSFIIHTTKTEDFPKFAFKDPGTSLCNGKDRIIYLSMSIAPRNMAVVTHHALLQTFGGGKYAMLYQSYSGDAHKDAQGKSYRMTDYLAAVETYLKTGKDGDLSNMPPVVNHLPCDCSDMAAWLQGLLDTTTASVIKSEYNRMFTPQNDKASVKAGLTTFWGSVWQEKDYFQLYKFAEGVPAKTLSSSLIEAAAVHHAQQRVKSPAALLDLKRARKQQYQQKQRARQQHLRPANVLIRQD